MLKTKIGLKAAWSVIVVIIFQAAISGCQPRIPPVYESIQISDKDIVEFNNKLRHMLRRNMNWSSIIRYSSSVLAVGAAVSAGALGIAGAAKETIGYLALSGGFIGDLQSIFNARNKARAYQQGVEHLEDAEGRFIDKSSQREEKPGLVSNKNLTPEGADLFKETVASLKLVEQALVSQIPTLEQVKKAVGEYKRLEVFPTTVSWVLGKSVEITVLRGHPATQAASGDTNFVKAKVEDGKIKLNMIGSSKKIKPVKVVITNAQGATTFVTVTPPKPPPEEEEIGKKATKTNFHLAVNEWRDLYFAKNINGYNPRYSNDDDPINIDENIEVAPDGRYILRVHGNRITENPLPLKVEYGEENVTEEISIMVYPKKVP